jgi:hypothetical protein
MSNLSHVKKLDLFTLAHIRKLDEIQRARVKSGRSGIGLEVEELIRRLESGGIGKHVDDPRWMQAKTLWDFGFGCAPNLGTFEAYLATIPEIPAGLVAHNPDFPLLTLVDPRLGHVCSCRLIDLRFVEYTRNDQSLVPFDARHAMPTDAPYWVRAHDGSPNLNRKPSDCRAECIGELYAGTADVGIAIWIQHGEGKCVMDLPGSVFASNRVCCAYLGTWLNVRELNVGGTDYARPRFGSVVFILG